MSTTLYDFTVNDIDGKELHLSKFKGKVVLFVNVASKCGYTKQYSGLQDLYNKYQDKGFVVIGAPCDQFFQELDTEKEISEFCNTKYGVTFPLTSILQVNGTREAPVYRWLKKSNSGLFGVKLIKWNFEKFLINREGKVFKHYGSMHEPKDIASDIEALL